MSIYFGQIQYPAECFDARKRAGESPLNVCVHFCSRTGSCPPKSGCFFVSSGECRLRRSSPHFLTAHLRGSPSPRRLGKFFERSSDEHALAGAGAPSGRFTLGSGANISYGIILSIFMLSSHTSSIVGSHHSCWG